MKVFISVDMEGVTGVTDPEDVLPDGADYARGRVFMTGDANAAILGAYDAGADEVLVNDSHWTMRNLLLEDLDPRARMIKGFQKPMCMVQGLDASYDAAVFVGYHSCAGTEGGVLNHTLLGKEVQNLLLDGEPIGETRLNALVAGELGVPVAFVAGDDKVCQEARAVLGEDLPDLRGQGRARHAGRLVPAPGGHGAGNPGGRGRRDAGSGSPPAARARWRADLHVRVELHDDRVDLRVHSGRGQADPAHHRVPRELAEPGDAGDRGPAAARPPGGPAEDLQLTRLRPMSTADPLTQREPGRAPPTGRLSWTAS